jgi:hypothetical protein
MSIHANASNLKRANQSRHLPSTKSQALLIRISEPDTASPVHKLALDARISVQQIVLESEPEDSFND